MASTSNSLIIGVAAGYKNDVILPFLKSLRATSYAGKVCLFVGNTNASAMDELKSYADIITLDGLYGEEITKHHLNAYVRWLAKVRVTKRVRRLYPALFRLALATARGDQRQSLRLDLEQKLEGYQSLRYRHYLNYLQKQAPNTDFVMLSDVRDVIFQTDPFDHAFRNDLEVTLEANHLKIGQEPFNSRWIENLYGQIVLRKIGSSTISCSGTTLGTQAGMRRYLAEMDAEVMKHGRPLGSHDQGIHNYLLRTGLLDPVTIYTNGQGPVLTMSIGYGYQQNSEGRLVNDDQSVVPVVHQYDRHQNLAKQIYQSLMSQG